MVRRLDGVLVIAQTTRSRRTRLFHVQNGVACSGRVAQTVSNWVTYRNDRVVRLKHGLQRDEPRDATPKQGFLLRLQEEVALPPRWAWDFDGSARCAHSGSLRS